MIFFLCNFSFDHDMMTLCDFVCSLKRDFREIHVNRATSTLNIVIKMQFKGFSGAIYQQDEVV